MSQSQIAIRCSHANERAIRHGRLVRLEVARYNSSPHQSPVLSRSSLQRISWIWRTKHSTLSIYIWPNGSAHDQCENLRKGRKKKRKEACVSSVIPFLGGLTLRSLLFQMPSNSFEVKLVYWQQNDVNQYITNCIHILLHYRFPHPFIFPRSFILPLPVACIHAALCIPIPSLSLSLTPLKPMAHQLNIDWIGNNTRNTLSRRSHPTTRPFYCNLKSSFIYKYMKINTF